MYGVPRLRRRRIPRWLRIPIGLGFLALALLLIVGIATWRPATPPESLTGAHSEAIVVEVVDGDTLKVVPVTVDPSSAESQTVRILGIDTPETVDPEAPVECFGPEASSFLGAMLPPLTEVTLVTDPHQQDTDQYGRMLRHVVVGGDLVAERILAGGYGVRYEAASTDLDQRFIQAQEAAKEQRAGLWGSCFP
ncbi:hypothetical protein ASG80_21430 [Agromyces sp. Soil535]|nr:hypothetical protein ASG80_21430 [Agromyces sp. Soil535]